MSETYRFLTIKSEHLFGLAKLLVGGIDPAFLHDPAGGPVIVSVRGSLRSGKRIIFDTAREMILGKNLEFNGKKLHDEYYTGSHLGRPLQMSYIDSAYGFGYEGEFKAPRGQHHRITEQFLERAGNSGFIVVQNDHTEGQTHAWIDIWIESENKICKYHKDPERTKVKGPLSLVTNLGREFRRRTGPDSWTRYVEVTVRNQALLDSPLFRQRLEMLEAGRAKPFWESLRGETPIYGFNLPRRRVAP